MKKPEDLKRASKLAEKNMREKLKTWHPTDIRALENIRYAYNNFVPNKIKG